MLLTIVNDILDLATVDAGIMELDIAEVDVDQTIAAAAELIADRLRGARDRAEDRDRRRAADASTATRRASGRSSTIC